MDRVSRARGGDYLDGATCRATLGFKWDAPGMREPHSCTLQLRHFGQHLCWCGCLFYRGRVFGVQLPLEGDAPVEIERLGNVTLVHHVERP